MAQNITFGNVSPQDFNTSKLKVDTTKGAIIISDVGVSTFEGNNKGWFTLVFKHKKRILILNKNAFDLAKVEIPLYKSTTSNNEEAIDKVRGSTYNLVDGKVVETKLNTDGIFKDNYDKNHVVKKFSMPAVKEGSILEYSYTINSDFLFNLQPWDFQGSYPRVWSEYKVSIPDFFDYVQISQGFVKYDITERPTRYNSYDVRVNSNSAFSSDLVKVEANVTDYRWVIKNVPALTQEKYTSTLRNYIAKKEFQLSGINFKNQPYQEVMGSWQKAGEKLLEDDDFGSAFRKNNNWLDDDMKKIVPKGLTDLQKARTIYYYVKDNIKCTDVKGMMLSRPVKDVFKSKSGSVPEVNLLLITMLRHENLTADPIILSTRSNGIANAFYPLMNQYNYVVSKVTIDNNDYFLDATQPYLGFNHLPSYTYNGGARVITANPTPIDISADNLPEYKRTSVILFSNEKSPGKWEGSFKSEFGYDESCRVRDIVRSKGKAEYEKELTKPDLKITEIAYENMDSLEKPMAINYQLALGEDGQNDIIYFNPMLTESYTSNPFQSAERLYPVEMPFKIDEMYSLNMEIPQGYEVDELPKQTKANLNDGEGFFEYLITKSGDQINMRSHIKLEKATFLPEDYESIRGFYALIVKKQSEQIVLKKKK